MKLKPGSLKSQTCQEKKKKRRGAQINKIRNEKGKVKMDTTETQRALRDYYK